MKLPVYAIAVQGRPQVSVASLGRPAVASVAVRGQQGAQGIQGERGPQGSAGRFGQLRIADTVVDPEDNFPAGVRQQLRFVPDPAQTQNFLHGPFTSVTWVNNRFVARPNGRGDWQDFIVNLLVIPQFGGGIIYADLDVGTAAPVATAAYALRGSGEVERVTFRLQTQTLDGFLNNGAAIFLTGTVPFVIQSEAIVYLPLSTGNEP
ncbi:hypothetical protein [Methylorubrum populi]|uniref:Phage tail fiber protein n=1 Tax=Methylorubrum populi TaxID=223967 RepID=A0A833JA53_9HYPH|nr:hypothetical protein [Methylorubrum populi]KAB7788065.1 Phage tail fiber protein [Methylorubrum populi]